MWNAFLVNGALLDLAPARVMRARSVALQRQLAAHDWLLRRKSDGRYLACAAIREGHVGWTWLLRADAKWRLEADALARQAMQLPRRASGRAPAYRGASRVPGRQREACQPTHTIGSQYTLRTGLERVPEPSLLAFGGMDRYGRPLWLDASAAVAWARLHTAAARDNVALEPISGFRSRDYQVGIFRRKLARGQSLDEILTVNAAPGFSEHHSGRALDIGTPGDAPAEASFEGTSAFEWLTINAQRFGFAMSYPRGNPHGIAYEPWHWMWHPSRSLRC